MKATTIHAPFDIRLSEVDAPDDPRPDRRDRADHRLVHLRLRPVALPRREHDHRAAPAIGHEFVGIVEEIGSEVSTVRRATSSSRRSCTPTTPAPTAGPASSPPAPTAASGAARTATAPGRRRAGRVRPRPARRRHPRGHPRGAGRRPGPVAAGALRRHGHRLARGRGRRREAGRHRGGRRRRGGRPLRGARRVADGRRARGRHVAARVTPEDRQEFGATDIVAERGEEGEAAIRELTGGVGADAVLECVGTGSR